MKGEENKMKKRKKRNNKELIKKKGKGIQKHIKDDWFILYYLKTLYKLQRLLGI
jgi:hypothetical protein